MQQNLYYATDVEQQSKLISPDAKAFCFGLYADKSKLSSFGTQKGYPVVVRCMHLPTLIHNGTGVGGGMVVGWLPVVMWT